MSKWRTKGLPRVNPKSRVSNTGKLYSVRVLVQASFIYQEKNKHLNDRVEPRFGMVFYEKDSNARWIVEGMMGTLKIHGWMYITKFRP